MKYIKKFKQTILSKLEKDVLMDMNSMFLQTGRETCTLEEIEDWWHANKNTEKTKGKSTYGIKHTLEREVGKYCANNWLKYVLVKNGFKAYTRYPAAFPTPQNVMINSANYYISPYAVQP